MCDGEWIGLVGWWIGCILGRGPCRFVEFLFASIGYVYGTFLNIFLPWFFSLAHGFQYIDTIGDLYIDHFAWYQ